MGEDALGHDNHKCALIQLNGRSKIIGQAELVAHEHDELEVPIPRHSHHEDFHRDLSTWKKALPDTGGWRRFAMVQNAAQLEFYPFCERDIFSALGRGFWGAKFIGCTEHVPKKHK